MNSNIFNWVIVVVVIALLYWGWRWYFRRIPKGSSRVQPTDQLGRALPGRRQIALALIGTQSVGIGIKALDLILRVGGAGAISVIYLVEMDRRERDKFKQFINQRARVLLDRLVVCESDLYPVGFENRPFHEVAAEFERWGPEAVAGAEQACRLANRQEGRPGILIAICSPGGHGPLALSVVEKFCSFFKITAYAISSLPDEPRARSDFAITMQEYRKSGLFRGILIGDNWTGAARVDAGLSMFLASIVGGTYLADAPAAAWNLLPKLFAEDPGGHKDHDTWMAMVSTWTRSIPLHWLPGIPGIEEPIAYTQRDRVIEAALDGHGCVQSEELKGIPLPAPAPGTRRYFYFCAPLYPGDLREIGDHVDQGLRLDPAKDAFNLLSVSARVTPYKSTDTPVVMLLVQALRDGFMNVQAHAQGLPLPAPVQGLKSPANGQATVTDIVPIGPVVAKRPGRGRPRRKEGNNGHS